MIARCQWTFAKNMPWAPHEYIVRGKCPLMEEEFLYFVDMQRRFGVHEHWGKYYPPCLYIDDYKYWTMGAPCEETTVVITPSVTKHARRNMESQGFDYSQVEVFAAHIRDGTCEIALAQSTGQSCVHC